MVYSPTVNRLVKHSGYGNSAGLLGSLGLLAGTGGPEESDDEGDSDTEEYEQQRHM